MEGTEQVIFQVVIPARYGSTRLPGKPLAMIKGKPMIIHCLENALRSDADEVIVATDDYRVLREVGSYGRLTSPEAANGAERVLEAATQAGWTGDDFVVNLQGDQPFLPPEVINLVARTLGRSWYKAEVATLCKDLSDRENPNVVKVNDVDGLATKFSRTPFEGGNYEHLGIYAYTVNALRKYVRLPRSPGEIAENLEQLRFLENGYNIAIAVSPSRPEWFEINTPEDLERANGHQSR